MERAYPHVELAVSEIESLCAKFFKKGKLHKSELLSGGAVNTTYRLFWENASYILRLYVRDPEFADVEKNIYELVHARVPVPRLLHKGHIKTYPFALFEFVDKRHIFEIRDNEIAFPLSYEIGKTLAAVHSFHFPEAGLFGKDFVIHTHFEEGSSPYLEYIQDHFIESSLAWQRLGEEKARRLLHVVHENAHLFPRIDGGGRLVHSDFKPVNLLWSREKGLTVLDWEFAHSGHPLLDFAVLLRHFRDFPFSAEGLEKGYLENGGELSSDWMRKARLTDIINVVQLMNMSAERPRLFASLEASLNLVI